MSDTKLDYRKILVWYINHVGTCEGVDFLGERYEPNFNRSRLTSEEWKELNRLSEEANIEYYWEETMSILVDEYIQSTAAGLTVDDFVTRVLRRLISGHIIMDKINHGITTVDSGQSGNQYVVTNLTQYQINQYVVVNDPQNGFVNAIGCIVDIIQIIDGVMQYLVRLDNVDGLFDANMISPL